jgi:hypothetical protein
MSAQPKHTIVLLQETGACGARLAWLPRTLRFFGSGRQAASPGCFRSPIRLLLARQIRPRLARCARLTERGMRVWGSEQEHADLQRF